MRGSVYGNVKAKAARTYNYKRALVTDHRTGVTLPLKQVMEGRIEPFIEAGQKLLRRPRE